MWLKSTPGPSLPFPPHPHACPPTGKGFMVERSRLGMPEGELITWAGRARLRVLAVALLPEINPSVGTSQPLHPFLPNPVVHSDFVLEEGACRALRHPRHHKVSTPYHDSQADLRTLSEHTDLFTQRLNGPFCKR